MYSFYNPNPVRNNTRDCAIRAVSKVLDMSWERAFALIASMAYQMGETMDNNAAWGAVLRQNGYYRDIIPNTCPDCYTINDFCIDHPNGRFVVVTSSHAVAVIDGVLYDSMDTGEEIPLYFWYKEKENV